MVDFLLKNIPAEKAPLNDLSKDPPEEPFYTYRPVNLDGLEKKLAEFAALEETKIDVKRISLGLAKIAVGPLELAEISLALENWKKTHLFPGN